MIIKVSRVKMKKIVIAGTVVLGTVLLLLAGLAGYFWFVILGDGNQSIARNVSVTNEWTEIKIDPPVRPRYRHQSIELRPVDFSVDRGSKDFKITLPDGTVIEPEIEIYDESGNVFTTRHTGFTMKSEGYATFSPKPNLPTDRKYTRLKVRSNVPFVCDHMIWIDYDPK